MAMRIGESSARSDAEDGKRERFLRDHQVHNLVLRRIPEIEFYRLRPHLEFVSLKNGVILEIQGEKIESAYFMNQGIASMIVETSDGKSVEVGVAGREGMIGLEIAADFNDFGHQVVVQVPGAAFKISSRKLRELLPSLPELTRILLRHLAMRGLEFAQGAACNRLHETKQRLARWLLLTHDRLGTDLISTTHDFLSRMVGTDRPTVSVVLAELERHGIVQCGRASILITDRTGLERQSCECYPLFKRLYLGLAA
jgi:CRP-like cAMP-binding protein